MKNLKKNISNNNAKSKQITKNNYLGITLIALVVTIVVLLILAGVTLNYTIGDNGIIKEAQKAKNEAIEKTENALEDSQNLAEEIAEEDRIDGVNKGRIYISTDLSSSNITTSGFTLSIGVTYSDYELSKIEWFYKLDSADSYSAITDTYTASPSNVETSVTQTHRFSNLSGGTYSVYAIAYDVAGHYQKSSTILTGVIQIGSTVIYSPSGSYVWQAFYYASDDSCSDVQLSASGDYAINSWKILAIDGDKLTLVPSSPTDGRVPLQGAQGYNNAVKLLNDACSALYGNSTKSITARSINIEDIENHMTDTALSEAHSYSNYAAKYGEKVETAYSNVLYTYYPVIYDQELKSVINGKETTSGLGLSEQPKFISKTQSTILGNANQTNAINGLAQANVSINPYQTYWYKDATNIFKGIEKGATDNYYNLFFPTTAACYWIASRCIDTYEGSCSFRVRDVSWNGISNSYMYGSGNHTANTSLPLFPIVTLSSSLLSGSKTNGLVV